MLPLVDDVVGAEVMVAEGRLNERVVWLEVVVVSVWMEESWQCASEANRAPMRAAKSVFFMLAVGI